MCASDSRRWFEKFSIRSAAKSSHRWWMFRIRPFCITPQFCWYSQNNKSVLRLVGFFSNVTHSSNCLASIADRLSGLNSGRISIMSRNLIVRNASLNCGNWFNSDTGAWDGNISVIARRLSVSSICCIRIASSRYSRFRSYSVRLATCMLTFWIFIAGSSSTSSSFFSYSTFRRVIGGDITSWCCGNLSGTGIASRIRPRSLFLLLVVTKLSSRGS